MGLQDEEQQQDEDDDEAGPGPGSMHLHQQEAAGKGALACLQQHAGVVADGCVGSLQGVAVAMLLLQSGPCGRGLLADVGTTHRLALVESPDSFFSFSSRHLVCILWLTSCVCCSQLSSTPALAALLNRRQEAPRASMGRRSRQGRHSASGVCTPPAQAAAVKGSN